MTYGDLTATISSSPAFNRFISKGKNMDKDRIKGAADQAKGAIKDAAGRATGDTKLQADGKADKLTGKVESAVGGLKDAVRNVNKT
jgi:uncharacterized protein YjbJ (UPF0337 family)